MSRMFKNSKKQGDAGLGRAIAYFTELGYDIALPLTDSADWDLIVEINGELKRVQVKTSSVQAEIGKESFALRVMGGNRSWNKEPKYPQEQNWDLLFVYHHITKRMALFQKEDIKDLRSSVRLCEKYDKYVVK